MPDDPGDVPLPLDDPDEPEVAPEPDVEPGSLELPEVPGVGVVPVVPDVPGVPEPDVPLVPGRLDVPDVPLFGLKLEFGALLLAPPQLAESIRTEVTITRGIELVSSAAPAVPSGEDADERRLRALRRGADGGGINRPITSTCCPWCPSSTSEPRRANSFAVPLVPALPLIPALPVAPELDVEPATDAPADAPVDDAVLLPAVIRAFVSVYEGDVSTAACPRCARVRAWARAELVPVVAVLDAEVLPVVPTAPLTPELPMRQPTSVTSCAWLLAAVCDVRAERVRRERVGVCVVPVWLPVAPEVAPDPCAVTPLVVEPRCVFVLLCAPSAAVQPIISATTAESPARFILFLLDRVVRGSRRGA